MRAGHQSCFGILNGSTNRSLRRLESDSRIPGVDIAAFPCGDTAAA
jgi:hypothetical protein